MTKMRVDGQLIGNYIHNGFEAGLNRYDFMTFLLQDVTHPTGWR